jgi:hypothetical protein
MRTCLHGVPGRNSARLLGWLITRGARAHGVASVRGVQGRRKGEKT